EKSVNRGQSFNASFNLPPSGSGDWVTPLTLDPLHPDTIYTGFSRIWRSFNGGISFSAVGPSINANFDVISVAESENNILYFSETQSLWKSEDYGNSNINLT